MVPTLLSKTDQQVRPYSISLSAHGNFTIRQGQWELIEVRNDALFDQQTLKVTIPKENTFQLYNVEEDIGEKKNVYAQHPEIVAKLQQLLKECRDNGRSRP